MHAAVLVEPGKIEIRSIKTPEPGEGELLVRIKTALTCGTDLKAFVRGHPMIPMPGLFGHEFSGTVASAGKGVRRFKEGDEVMAVHSAPCRSCRYCKKGLFNLCDQLMKSKVLGAFAEYILLPSPIVKQHVFCKPHGLSFEEAAFLEPLSCVVHGMSALKIRDGDRILIIGAGPIGLLHLLVARQRGARTMITGLEQDRLSSARKLGAHATVDPSDLGPALDDFSEGLGVDYLCECTGAVDVWERSVNYVRRGGTVILFGGCAAGTRACYDTYRLHYDALTLKGVFHYTPRDVKEAYRLLLEGMDVSSLVSDRYPLRDVKTPFEKLSRGEGIKYAIVP